MPLTQKNQALKGVMNKLFCMLVALFCFSSIQAQIPVTVYIYPEPGSLEEVFCAGKPIAHTGELHTPKFGPVILFLDGHYFNISLENHTDWCPCKNEEQVLNKN